MADPDALDALNFRPDARLSRRSLIAIGAILVTASPIAIKRAHAAKGGVKGSNGNAKCPPTANSWQCQCFLRGTRLATPEGEIPIEALAIGDVVMTRDGGARAIRWIGVRKLSRVESWNEDVLPIRIARGALGSGVPHRDLYVTRDHLLFFDGVLIPASSLINGRTISVATPDADALEYFHVELGVHDVVLAEGASCESLRIVWERSLGFDNAAEYEALYGQQPRMDMAAYAPIALFNGGRSELKSRMRSALAPVIDIRQPLDIVRDNLEARSLLSKAA